jgi:hypothetical protein
MGRHPVCRLPRGKDRDRCAAVAHHDTPCVAPWAPHRLLWTVASGNALAGRSILVSGTDPHPLDHE